MTIRTLFAALVAAALCLADIASAEPPAIKRTAPLAIAPEQTTRMHLFGSDLGAASDIWTNLPCHVELAPQRESDKSAECEIVPATGVQPGIYGLRVATPAGVTPIHLFMVDDLPTVAEAEADDATKPNNRTDMAQPITPPVAIDGIAENESYDYYRFEAAAGDRLSVEVVARRLGSPMDPLVVLYDARGHELAYSDDDPSLGIDGRFAHVFEESGTYFLEVRDIRYQGGDDYFYRLRLGGFPIVSTAYPLAATKGSVVQVAALGMQLDGLAAKPIGVPSGSLARGLSVPFAFTPSGGSSLVRLEASDGVEQVELEPNDDAKQATAIIPGGASGRIERPGDRDHYAFTSKKNQGYRLVGATRRFGSPVDLYLRVLKPDGSLLTEVDSPGTGVALATLKIPDDGTYAIAVEDMHGRGGPEYSYHLALEPMAPGFTLAADKETYYAPTRGVVVMRVKAERRAYDGPIELVARGTDDRAGAQTFRGQIAKGKSDGLIRGELAEGMTAGKIYFYSITGSAKVGDAVIEAHAGTLDALAAAMGGLATPPIELDGSIALGVGPVFEEFLDLKVTSDVIEVAQRSTKATVDAQVVRKRGFIGNVEVRVEGLPRGVAAPKVTLARNQATANLAIELPPAIALGDYPVRVVASGEHEDQPRELVHEVVLRVVEAEQP